MDVRDSVIYGFKIEGQITGCVRYGCGHINDTYLVSTEAASGTKRYILQRINDRVFRDVPALMRNIAGVTSYIIAKLAARGQSDERALRIIPAKDGNSYSHTEDGYYRLYHFIDGAASFEIPSEPHLVYLSGKGYGRFQNLLDGYPAEQLTESIPHFHDTVDRFSKFENAVKADVAGRAAGVMSEIEFYRSRSAYAHRIVSLLIGGAMPLRVTHNDTKLNNVLIDVQKDVAAAVIDLDTVMPGSIVYDFGDGIRSGANRGAEDEKDLSKVGFSLTMFEAFARGFLEEVGEVLTPCEIDNLAFGAILMTYECGMRFLTDYLEGDRYFKIHRDGHNLDRTRTQIKMIEDMELRLPEMNGIVRYYATKNQNRREP